MGNGSKFLIRTMTGAHNKNHGLRSAPAPSSAAMRAPFPFLTSTTTSAWRGLGGGNRQQVGMPLGAAAAASSHGTSCRRDVTRKSKLRNGHPNGRTSANAELVHRAVPAVSTGGRSHLAPRLHARGWTFLRLPSQEISTAKATKAGLADASDDPYRSQPTHTKRPLSERTSSNAASPSRWTVVLSSLSGSSSDELDSVASGRSKADYGNFPPMNPLHFLTAVGHDASSLRTRISPHGFFPVLICPFLHRRRSCRAFVKDAKQTGREVGTDINRIRVRTQKIQEPCGKPRA